MSVFIFLWSLSSRSSRFNNIKVVTCSSSWLKVVVVAVLTTCIWLVIDFYETVFSMLCFLEVKILWFVNGFLANDQNLCLKGELNVFLEGPDYINR